MKLKFNKKDSYKDYKLASDYFEDEDLLKDEVKEVEKTKNFVVWMQQFSKQIIVVVFILYCILSVFSMVLVYLSFKQGMIPGIDTLIVETNNTFRDIVGGYIIKSAVENAVKIGGNYYVGVSDARLKAMKERMVERGIIKDSNNSSSDDIGDYSGYGV